MLVVGECLVDVVVRADGTSVERPGGSPANVAVGLGRQGVPVTLVTSYGDDARGALLADHLAASHVDVLVTAAPTSVAQAVLDESGAATYDFDLRWDLAAAPLPVDDWLHVGSLGAVLEPGASVVRDWVAGFAGTVSYDPNCRPHLMGVDAVAQVEALVAHADVVKCSDEDAAFLHPSLPLADLAERWLALGPSLVVVTRGPEGADAWTADGTWHVDVPFGAPVVDTVGAGDAFMTGLLLALSTDRDDVDAALATASRIARSTCEREGADPPWA